MRVDAFDFDLPQERIALRPASPRDASRMLLVGGDESVSLQDRIVRDLPDVLRPGDLLVFNDTKVIPARLIGQRHRGGSVATVEATLHMRVSASRWKAFVKGAKKLAVGDEVAFNDKRIMARVEGKGDAGEVEFSFALSGPELDEALVQHGNLPLPPYIAGKREQDEQDKQDYQTIYANEAGAVAAPTAGLHFTEDLMRRLAYAGIDHCFVTLHVGAGTFLPVKAEDTKDHRMHHEMGTISAAAAQSINACRDAGGRVVSVGTTSLRLLESAASADGRVTEWRGATDIFITPGFRFRVVDVLMTNFHLPRSTLFMLVSAFCGLETMRGAYAHAVEKHYRFYSYGDSSLLFRSK
ncbi:MAG: tRNA preQ1(34) S-adenosylmethionine ribosyltransferase-isomerase QueA [Ahrensia sp.]|nr:tRNA preQ1(34) S-adenosylmethionine ribosyltransferase-isomerase QueA [Ahrensia sp.]